MTDNFTLSVNRVPKYDAIAIGDGLPVTFSSNNSPSYPSGLFCIKLDNLTSDMAKKILSCALFGANVLYDRDGDSLKIYEYLMQQYEFIDCEDTTQVALIYRIQDCRLQQSDNGGNTWVNVSNSDLISDCTAAPRTIIMRGIVNNGTNTVQWRYTDETDSQWRTLINVDDGDDGRNGTNGTNGDDGRTPRLRSVDLVSGGRTGFRVDWQYTDTNNPNTWTPLGSVFSGLDGDDGANGSTPRFRSIRLDDNRIQIQYQYTDTQSPNTWTPIGVLSDGAKGDKGDKGDKGERGLRGESGNSFSSVKNKSAIDKSATDIAEMLITLAHNYALALNATDDSICRAFVAQSQYANYGEDFGGIFDSIDDTQYAWDTERLEYIHDNDINRVVALETDTLDDDFGCRVKCAVEAAMGDGGFTLPMIATVANCLEDYYRDKPSSDEKMVTYALWAWYRYDITYNLMSICGANGTYDMPDNCSDCSGDCGGGGVGGGGVGGNWYSIGGVAGGAGTNQATISLSSANPTVVGINGNRITYDAFVTFDNVDCAIIDGSGCLSFTQARGVPTTSLTFTASAGVWSTTIVIGRVP